jgi:hypothetical protein
MQAATAASIPHLVTILRSPAFSDNPSAPSNAPETPGNIRKKVDESAVAGGRSRERSAFERRG